MRNILLIGAGKTSPYLVKYLSDNSEAENWKVIVADANIKQAETIVGKLPGCTVVGLNVTDETERAQYIKKADVVISLLPSSLHIVVAEDCIKYKKHLLNASYVSPEIKGLHEAAKDAGILLLNEMGVDPGIDHMASMALIDRVVKDGGKVNVFKSYTGGLIAPESNDNPWSYKITWNPRKIVLAGQATAHYFNEGKLRYIPAHRVFGQVEKIKLHSDNSYEAYINRDSLKYKAPYGIDKAHTIIRGTLRHKGFCKKWNAVVNLGLTDDSIIIEDATNLTYKEFAQSFLPSKMDLETFLWKHLDIEKGSKDYKAIEWLGLMSNEKIGLQYVTPAQIIQKLIEKKWKLKANDKDEIVMYNEIHWSSGKKESIIQSSLEVRGENRTYTAMAKTVGLPLAIATKLLLQNKIKERGVVIPVAEEIYKPTLKELEKFGVVFKEKESPKKKGFVANFKLF